MYILCKCYSIYGIPVIVYYVVYITWKPAIKLLYIGVVLTLLNLIFLSLVVLNHKLCLYYVSWDGDDTLMGKNACVWLEERQIPKVTITSLLNGVSQEEIWITPWSQDRMDCFNFFMFEKILRQASVFGLADDKSTMIQVWLDAYPTPNHYLNEWRRTFLKFLWSHM